MIPPKFQTLSGKSLSDNFCADNTAMTALDFHYLQFAQIGNFFAQKQKKQPSVMDDCKKYR